jgi:hypothetical protein
MEVTGEFVYKVLYHGAFWLTASRLWLAHKIPFFAK